jgi:DnaJ family protein C protein 28
MGRVMDKWGKLVEERLQEALAEGKFANIEGKGRPLDLDDDPLADPAQWMARHILRNSGMSLPWVEERRRIEAEFTQARERLERSQPVNATGCEQNQLSAAAELRWQQGVADFQETAAALNRRIRTYNLTVPHVRFQRRLIQVEREVSRLQPTTSRMK